MVIKSDPVGSPVITTEELMMDELSCGVNIEESDIIDAFRRRSLNGQLMKRGNK